MRRRASDRSGAPSFFARHRTRIVAAGVDFSAILGITGVAVMSRAPFWPSLAIAATAYVMAATLFSTHGFGVAAAEWLIRVVGAMPAAKRRLVSSRAS